MRNACLLMLGFWLAAAPAPSAAEESSPAVAMLEEFEGNVVFITSDESTSLEKKTRSTAILSPKLIQLGNRYFLYGKTYLPEAVKEEYADAQKSSPHARAIPCDRIQGLYVYTIDAFEEYYSRRYEDNDE